MKFKAWVDYESPEDRHVVGVTFEYKGWKVILHQIGTTQDLILVPPQGKATPFDSVEDAINYVNEVTL